MSNRARPTGKSAGAQAKDSTTFVAGARAGLVAYGIVHLLIAGLAIQIAWSHGGKSATQQGAMQSVAEAPLGTVLLWVAGLGLVALALWQVTEAIWGHRACDGAELVMKRLGSAGRFVLYGVLAWSAINTALGSGGGGGGSKEEGLTARVMAAPGGRLIVIAVALVILAIAGRQIHKAWTGSFKEDLRAAATMGHTGRPIVRLGQVGYASKGLAIGGVGALFAWSAITFDADKAGGLDDALSKLLAQPFGAYLVTVVALGFAAFGAYCFVWAKELRT